MSTLKYVSTLGTGFQRTTISNGGGGYTSGATSIVVADGSVFPATGDFWVGVGDQDPPDFIKQVTARTGNTLTVPAGVAAGTDGNKADGVTVQWVLPPEGLDQLQSERNRVMTVAAFDALAAGEYRNGDRIILSDSIYEVIRDSGAWTYLYNGQRVVRPPSAGWTTDNLASSTIDSTSGYEYISKPKSGTVSLTVQYRTPPSTPYSVKALLLFDAFGAPPGSSGTKSDAGFNICFRDSDGSLAELRFWHDSGGLGITTAKWTSTTSYGSAFVAYQTITVNSSLQLRNPKWLGMRDDGSNLLFYWSIDGLGTPGVSGHWKLFDTQTYAAAGMGASPNGIGYAAYANGNAVELGLISWEVI